MTTITDTARPLDRITRITPTIYGLQPCGRHRLVTRRSACSGAVCRCCGGWPGRRVFPGRRTASGVAKAPGPGVRQAGVSVLRAGEGDRAWCMVLVPAGGWGGMTAPGRVAWVALRGRALGCRHGSGAGCGLVPAGGPGPVQEHRDGGGHDRGGHGDEGDLPAGHAAGDDGLHRGRRRPVAAAHGRGRAGRTRPGPRRWRPAGRWPVRPGRRPGGGWGGMGGCGSW